MKRIVKKESIFNGSRCLDKKSSSKKVSTRKRLSSAERNTKTNYIICYQPIKEVETTVPFVAELKEIYSEYRCLISIQGIDVSVNRAACSTKIYNKKPKL